MKMIVSLTQPFVWRCPDLEAILDGCDQFNTFCARLERSAKNKYPPPRNESDADKKFRIKSVLKYKGDGFELFVEAMIRLFPCDKRLGLIENYQIISGRDIGVDGHGICGFNLKPFTVQCKYRQSNWKLTGNRDRLQNFSSASLLHFGVDQNPDPITHKCNMLIVSSADSLDFFTDCEVFGQMVHAMCRPGIKKLVDNNPTFWKYFLESCRQTLKLLKENV